MVKRIMFQGTGSNVGKSLIAAAMCRIAIRKGIRTVPYKSQNMALNSYITDQGLEMGRAQVVQAQCCCMEPDVDMNPILLKPNSDMGSQVIVCGEVVGNMPAVTYYTHKQWLLEKALEAFNRVTKDKDLAVIEGAGSPAEINLRENDIVNMGLAEKIDAPVILVADIDRGGVFASIYGTYMLLSEEDRSHLKGFIINKFRGDVTLLQPGIDMIEEKIGIPCLGVMPYGVYRVDDEDSVAERIRTSGNGRFNIGVVGLSHISNFTDLTVFDMYEDIQVSYYRHPDDLKSNPIDLLILPGSKNTVDDMLWLRKTGMDQAILECAGSTPVIGICGGYQLLGKWIEDPDHVESSHEKIEGLGLLNTTTVLLPEKTRTRIEGSLVSNPDTSISGYEIHMGETNLLEGTEPFVQLEDGRFDGAVDRENQVLGSYLHGLFDHDQFREKLLEALGYEGKAEAYQDFREQEYNRLADDFEEYIDWQRILEIAGFDHV